MAKSSYKVKVEGFKELDKALGELPKRVAASVVSKVLMEAAAPMVSAAQSGAPVDEGILSKSITVSKKLSRSQRSGKRGTKRHFSEVYVGPESPDGFYGHLVEFGTKDTAAKPFMRPAFDAHANDALDYIKDNLDDRIASNVEKIAARAAKKAAKAARTARK
jgi:HK97 gp10 family phage protein